MRQIDEVKAVPSRIGALRRPASIAIGFLTMFSCSDQVTVGTPTVGSRATHVEGELPVLSSTVLLEGEDLGVPFKTAMIGDYLVVLDLFAEPAFHILDGSSGRLLGSYGTEGDGPGEFRSPWSIDPVSHRCCAFWLYDIGTARLTFVDVDRLLGDESSLGDSSVTLITERVAFAPMWLNDRTIVSPGLFDRGRLAVFDVDGRVLRWLGAIPGEADIQPHLRQHAYQATMALHPSRSMAALGARHAGLLQILDLSSGVEVLAQAVFPFEPTYGVGRARGDLGLVILDDTRFGYVDVAATDSMILALYSGRSHRMHGSKASLGEFVHGFDWKGRLLSAVQLDTPVLSIAVDRSGHRLYALRHEPEPAVLLYSLDSAH